MDRCYPSAIRIERRTRVRQRIIAGALSALALSAMAFALTAENDPYVPAVRPAPAAAGLAQAGALDAATAPAPRRVYRHSVVPGGVTTQAELAHVLARDKVAAAHYADFDVSRARPVTVSAARAVYVSYRKGDQIYWTARKLMLEEGETLFSDGRNEMRARCANRISDVPRFPVEANGPGAEILDAVTDASGAETPGELAHVGAPDLAGLDDMPGFAGHAAHVPAPDGATVDAPSRDRAPMPFMRSPADWRAGMPWPRLAMTPVRPGLPVSAGPNLLLPVRAPPLSGNATVPAEPLAWHGDPPAPARPDPGPFIPPPALTPPAAPPGVLPDSPAPSAVPEPASLALVAAALVAMRAGRRRG